MRFVPCWRRPVRRPLMQRLRTAPGRNDSLQRWGAGITVPEVVSGAVAGGAADAAQVRELPNRGPTRERWCCSGNSRRYQSRKGMRRYRPPFWMLACLLCGCVGGATNDSASARCFDVKSGEECKTCCKKQESAWSYPGTYSYPEDEPKCTCFGG